MRIVCLRPYRTVFPDGNVMRIASCVCTVHKSGRNVLHTVTKQLSRVVDEVPACLKDEIKIAFRSGILEKGRRIGQALL